MAGSIDFCTLGMFIIDEIHFLPPKLPVTDVVGGAGAYSALGARLLSPPPLSRRVGWIVDCGSDFPVYLREVLSRWETGCLFRETPDRLTTRGWNGYDENEFRAFRYTTPKLRLDENSLSMELIQSKSFHLICSASRCMSIIHGIDNRRRNEQKAEIGKPLYIWEPVPDLCTPEEMANCTKALRQVDIVSPNHSELGAFFNKPTEHHGEIDRQAIIECSAKWLESGIGSNGNGAVVVRAGKEGCYVATRVESRWIPAYHQSASKVVDPTGGGNTFLGGFAVGLVRCTESGIRRLEEAAIWGSVAASFAIEQVGMPELTLSPEGELWNNVDVRERLDELRGRLERYVQP